MRIARHFILVLFILCACKENETKTLFSSVPISKSNVAFQNSVTGTADFNIIEYLYFYNGGGVAIGDINQDGLPDIYFTSNQSSNKLYLNTGGLQFKDITIEAGVQGSGGWSTGVSMVDINGDGLLDIYVCNVSDYKGLKGHNELFINNGDLTFTERAEDYGLDFRGFSTQSAFFDYDKDGDLDMYLLNHSVHTIHSYGSSKKRLSKSNTAGDRLFESQMAQGTSVYKDVTAASGIYSSHIGYGLGIGISDINNDGWSDIYISNDFHENDYLYINKGNGTFSDSLQSMTGHTSRYSMGNDIADINNDGLFDIMTLDMLPGDPTILQKSAGEDNQEVYDIKLGYGYGHQYSRNTLQLNLGNNILADIALLTETYDTDWSWAPLICDLDNDGLNDIYIANGIYKRPNDLDYINFISSPDQGGSSGHSSQKMIEKMPSLKISNFAYRNTGNNTFSDSTSSWGLGQPSYSNGAAYGDLDNDGDLDLVINNVNQHASIYENRSNKFSRNNFISIKLVGNKFNRLGTGAKVRVVTQKASYTKELQPTRGFQSSVDPILNFGLGKIDKIDTIEVVWADGTHQVILEPETNKQLSIQKSTEGALYAYDKRVPEELTSVHDSLGLNFIHLENTAYNDYNREPLIPYRMSTEGPAIAIGDINNDQMQDVFIGGAKGQKSAIYVQTSKGEFELSNQLSLFKDLFYEDVDASFFDANQDGYQDLYVVSGGNEYAENHNLLSDRLYINDQKGGFEKFDLKQHTVKSNGACVKPADFDNDGDVDLFIGSNSVPGKYGVSPDSYLLLNDGAGNFFRNKELSEVFKGLGMVNDAVWADYDEDEDLDLVVVGNWMPITILVNEGGQFTKGNTGLSETNGWWQTIKATDLDNDGDMDLVAGNFGLNNKLKASGTKPVSLFVKDFDNNGQIDPVIFHHKGNKNIPFNSRDQLGNQIPSIKKKFNTYEKFASINGIESFFSEEQLTDIEEKYVYTYASTVFINNEAHKFESFPLPLEGQMSTINDVVVQDINGDGYKDIIAVGNFYGSSVSLGRFDAMAGAGFLGKGDGTFTFATPFLTSYDNRGEYRALEFIDVGGESYALALRNNQSLTAFPRRKLIEQLINKSHEE